jgi:hypothetical protein
LTTEIIKIGDNTNEVKVIETYSPDEYNQLPFVPFISETERTDEYIKYSIKPYELLIL